MRPRALRHRSLSRLIGLYALITLVPVLLLGAALGASYRSEARHRGLFAGQSEAVLVAQTAIEPVLDGRPLRQGLTPGQVGDLDRLVSHAVHGREVLRLRVRDLAGHVVFSDDGSGFGDTPGDEALDAADGETVARITHLNDDSDDEGSEGPLSVEVYLPLIAGPTHTRVGVLEIYLPYASIDADVRAGLHGLYLDLALGLAALYLVVFAIAWSVSRGLRRQVRMNRFLAEHDTLTDLPNRVHFLGRAEESLRRAAATGTTTVVAIIDFDRFKEVNDTLGHHTGDELLTRVARRLAAHTRPQDSVARLGGDEFGLVLTDVADPEDVLHRLRGVIEGEIDVDGLALSVESSIGYAVGPYDGTDVDTLLQRADVAMYVAKADHRGVARYDERLDHYDAANLTLIAELRRAIDGDELVLHYQPQADLGDGRVEAVEALVRWNHPTRGLLPPDTFIPLAEQTDLIDRLTLWVVRRALSDLRDFGPAGAHLSVAVNVSARNLARADFADQVVVALAEAGVDPGRLVLEITETALLSDPARAALALAELSRLGIRVSLDDFGTGQTSFGYLSSLPVHELKIDKSFILDMAGTAAHAAIVRSIVHLGHNLSLRVIGEGVETDVVRDHLRAAGCDVMQGYLLARPMPAGDLRDWLTTPVLSATGIG